MQGRIPILFGLLTALTLMSGCSPAAMPKGTPRHVARQAKEVGMRGRAQVGRAAGEITRGVKELPHKAGRGTRQLAEDSRRTLGALGVRTAVAPSPTLDVIAFVTNDNTKGPLGAPGLDYLKQHPKAVSYLAPLFYSVKADGSLATHVAPGVLAFARRYHVALMPLVNNENGNHAFLDNPTARRTALEAIVAAVKREHYAGVSIDFQLLPDTSRVALNTFMDELSARLRPIGKKVTVDVIPTEAQTGQHGAYDEATLARYADALVLMTYDRHDDTSPPGPVSPHAWVVSAVVHALHQGVPARKIYLGVNTYGYTWNVSKGSATTVPQRTAEKAPHVRWDAAAREAHATYTTPSGTHVSWFATDRSLKDKIAIARRYKLQGIAIWKVGYEDRRFWTTLLGENRPAAAARFVRRPTPFRTPARHRRPATPAGVSPHHAPAPFYRPRPPKI